MTGFGPRLSFFMCPTGSRAPVGVLDRPKKLFLYVGIRILPILANTQLKDSLCRLHFPYVPFRIPKRPVPHCDMACFGLQNGTFRKAERPVLQPIGYQALGQCNPCRRL